MSDAFAAPFVPAHSRERLIIGYVYEATQFPQRVQESLSKSKEKCRFFKAKNRPTQRALCAHFVGQSGAARLVGFTAFKGPDSTPEHLSV